MEARGERTWCGQCQAPELWPENIPAVELYLAAETQWRHAGMNGVPTGLDYAGVRALLELWPDPALDRPARFADLQTLEREHLRIIHERLIREAHKAATPTASRPVNPWRP